MFKLVRRVLVIGSLLGLIAIATPILFYVKDFYNLPRSPDPANWGAFGDYFGGILNPIISLLTLIVTSVIAVNISSIESRNHEETVHSPVKPFFTIATENFFSSDRSGRRPTLHEDFYDYSVPPKPKGPFDHLMKRFYLKISNKGLGIATEVNITFKIDVNKLLDLLIIDNANVKVTASDITTGEDGRKILSLSIQSAYYNYHSFVNRIWDIERIGLGIVEKDSVVKLILPDPIMDAFQLHNIISKLKNSDIPFPTILVTISYKNIHGKPLTAKFNVGLLRVQDYNDYSMFRVVQEQI